MKKFSKMLVLALALVVTMSIGAGSTSDAATKYVKKVAAVDKLTGKKTITLTVGKKATLKTTVTATKKKYNKAKYKKVTYKTSNKKVATVNGKGVITAKKRTGTAKITVTSKKNKKKATVKVKVVKGKVTKVTLNKKTTTLEEGKTEQLKASVKTKGKKANKTVKWTTSNKNVATVSSKGVVTAKKAGTVTIKATSTDGTKKSASCKVTVSAKQQVNPPAKEKYTTITPEAAPINVKVSVSITGDNKNDAIADLEKYVKTAVKEGDTKAVTIDGVAYTASFDGTNIMVTNAAGTKKTLAQALANKNSAVVEVTVGTKASTALKALSLVTVGTDDFPYTVTVGDFTFANAKVAGGKITSITINNKPYTDVSIANGVVEIKGDVSADFKDLNTKYAKVAVIEK